MAGNFYFGKIADIVAGSGNFASTLASGPTVFGISVPQSTAFGLLNTALQSAQTLCEEPGTRTRVTIQNRNTALKNMRDNAKLLAKIIYATSTVTDGMLTDLGLLPRTSRSPVPPPTEAPKVELVSVVGRMVKIRVYPAGATTKRGRPKGTVGANLYTFVGNVAPADPRDYFYEGTTTRSTVEIIFPYTVATGATARIAACWLTARGQRSIASAPLIITIQGGEILPESAEAA